MIECKPSIKEKGDVYLVSTSTQSDQDSWLIDSGASYHMTPHREWFFEYEKYDGDDILRLAVKYTQFGCFCLPSGSMLSEIWHG